MIALSLKQLGMVGKVHLWSLDFLEIRLLHLFFRIVCEETRRGAIGDLRSVRDPASDRERIGFGSADGGSVAEARPQRCTANGALLILCRVLPARAVCGELRFLFLCLPPSSSRSSTRPSKPRGLGDGSASSRKLCFHRTAEPGSSSSQYSMDTDRQQGNTAPHATKTQAQARRLPTSNMLRRG